MLEAERFVSSVARRALAPSLRAGLAAVVLLGCATATSNLRSAEDEYEAARYEDALVWLGAVEREVPTLGRADRAAYHYLRGMSLHRLGRRREARHELALAREVVGKTHVLPEEWARHLARVLAELEEAPAP